jgi:hypothetical protein
MIKASGDPLQVADPVTVIILKRSWIDLIDHRSTPPFLIQTRVLLHPDADFRHLQIFFTIRAVPGAHNSKRIDAKENAPRTLDKSSRAQRLRRLLSG